MPREGQVFSVNAFSFAIGPIRAGVWDRFTSTGLKVKDGQEMDFNAENLGQMVDNFAGRENMLAMCFDHQSIYVPDNGKPAPALAWYSALMLIMNGEVLKFASRDAQLQPPDARSLADGVYGYRSEVTSLGQELLAGGQYKYISPMFTTTGANEDGTPIGFDLMDVAATNIPFQDAVEITFHKLGAPPMAKSPAVKMDNSGLYKRLGLDDDATPEDAMSAMKGVLKKMDDDSAAAAKKLDDADMADGDADADDKSMDDADMKKMAAKKLDDADMDDADMDDQVNGLKKLAKDLGCEANLKAIADAVTVLKFSTTPKTEMARISSELAEVRQELEGARKEKDKEAAQRFAKAAISDGRWNPEEEAALVAFRMKEPKLAERTLQPKGTWTALQRLSKGGTPTGVERTAGEDFGLTSTDNSGEIGSAVSVEARKLAKAEKISFGKALEIIAVEKPQLYSSRIK